MLDHVELRAKDLEKTTKFYATVLAPIGYVQKQDGDTKGFGDETSYDFFIVKGDPSELHALRLPLSGPQDGQGVLGQRIRFRRAGAPAGSDAEDPPELLRQFPDRS